MDLLALRLRLRTDLDRLRAPEGYLRAGEPRYATLFGRDSLIAAWQTLRTDPSIAAATLRILASYQGRRVDPISEEEPGKILHEHRFDPESRGELPEWSFPYYGSVDSTLLYLVVADAYIRRTGDESLLADLWTAFEKAYRWIAASGDVDGDGFVEYARKNPHGLFHQGWKDGSSDHLRIEPPVALVEVQAYAAAASRAFASLAGRRGRKDLAQEAVRAADRIQAQFDRAFWMPDVSYYSLALDGAKQPRRAITSNPGHLFLMGVVPPSRVEAVVTRLFREDLWTPYGVRTHATSEPDFDPYGYHLGTIWPHDNWFLWRGLRDLGREADARRIREALLKAYDALGRIPELYAYVDGQIVDLSSGDRRTFANPLQAWSVGALLDMISPDEDRLNP